MKQKDGTSIDLIRTKIDELVGRDINMRVCRGRKQVKNYEGTVESAFSRVFVVKIKQSDSTTPSLTYSYSDVMCGDVVIEAV